MTLQYHKGKEMKTFKTFKSNLLESYISYLINESEEVIDNNVNLFDYTSPQNLKLINSYVGAIGLREYLVPEEAIQRLREKLQKIGLHFDKTPLVEGESGNLMIGLYRNPTETVTSGGYSDAVGTTTIDNMESANMFLNVNYQRTNASSYILDCKIT